jgi:hypothetical protein
LTTKPLHPFRDAPARCSSCSHSIFVRRPRILENILNIRSSTISVTYCFKIEAD